MNTDVEKIVRLARQPLNQEIEMPVPSEDTQRYPEPVLLDDPQLPDFPQDAFPPWMNDMVNAVAKQTETPRGLAAMNGLAVLATCCQKKFQVSPEPGYTEPTNLWVLPAMESGNRKTAVLNWMTGPLSECERKIAEELAPKIERMKSDRATVQERIQHLRREAAKGSFEDFENKKQEITQLENSLTEVPHVPRLWSQDVTPEQLGPLMGENEEAMSLLSDEGGIFEILSGRYNNGIPNLDLFLQSRSGSPVRIDRRSHPSLMLHAPTLTIGVSPQPDVLRGLTHKPGFRGRGLLARFLYLLPTSPLGFRTGVCAPILPAILDSYKDAVWALLNISTPTNEVGRPVPYPLTFTEQAHKEWKDFQQTVEKDLRPGGRFEFIKDWAGKLPGAAARIAGNLHCAKYAHGQPWSKKIDIETLTEALNIAAVLCAHALFGFDLMEANPVLEDAKIVWRRIEREQKTSFTSRECFQWVKGRFHFMDKLRPALSVLVERHYLFELEPPSGPGRPSPGYVVNPHLTEGWAT